MAIRLICANFKQAKIIINKLDRLLDRRETNPENPKRSRIYW